MSDVHEIARLRRTRLRATAEMTVALLLMAAGALELTAKPLGGLTAAAIAALAAGLVLCGIAESRFERVRGAERGARMLASGRHRPEDLAWLHTGDRHGRHGRQASYGDGLLGPTGALDPGGCGFDGGGGGDCGGGGD